MVRSVFFLISEDDLQKDFLEARPSRMNSDVFALRIVSIRPGDVRHVPLGRVSIDGLSMIVSILYLQMLPDFTPNVSSVPTTTTIYPTNYPIYPSTNVVYTI